MKQIINNIRNKPDHHKNRIILISVGVAIALLLIIWAIVGNGRRTTPDENFFQTFNSDVQTGKDAAPANPNNPTSN